MASNTITTALVMKTGSFNKKLDQVQRRLNILGNTANTVGRTLQYAVGGALIAAAANSVKAAVDFDLTVQKLKALSGPENARGVEKLAKTARLLGENSIYTASQVAEMQLSLKKLGLEVSTIDSMSESVLKFATAMDVDVNTAGETVINTMKKFSNSFQEFNTEQEKAEAISEQFAAATVNSALKFDTLRSSLNYAGAEANAAGFSFDQTAAILGKLADAGFNGSRGGVILRKVLQSVGKQGGNTLENFKGLINSQKEFNEVMQIVGVRAAGGTLALGGLGSEIDLLAELIRNSTGQVDAFSDAVEGSFMGRLKNVVSALEEVGIALLDQFEVPLKRAITQFASLIRTIDAEDVKKFGEAIVFVGKVLIASQIISSTLSLVKGLKGLFGIVGDLVKSNFGKFIATEFRLLGAAVAAVGAPFIIAVTIMAAGIGNLVDKFKRAKKEVEQYKKSQQGMVETVAAQAAAFAGLENLAPEEIYKRIQNGALDAMQAFQNGELAADGALIAETFIPQSAFDQIMQKAESLAGQFGTSYEEALKIAISDFAPVINAAEEAGEAIRAGFDGRYGGDPNLTKDMIKADAAAYKLQQQAEGLGTTLGDFMNDWDTSWPVGEESGLMDLALFGDVDEELIDEKEMNKIRDHVNEMRLFGSELQETFIGVGNIIGNAFQQAATGARAFGDALKQNLISAVSAVISKLIALTAAYGLAALAKALLDGGTSIAQGAAAITKSGFGSFLAGGMGFASQSTNNFTNLRTTGYVAGSDLVLTTGRGINANDRLYG